MKKMRSLLQGAGIPLIFFLLVMMALGKTAQFSQNGADCMTQLESRVSQALSQTEGAGTVSVVIRTMKPTQQSKGLTGNADAEEIPCGAVAVAQGGSDPLIRMRLSNALCALLGLHPSQVEVVGMKGWEAD